MSAKRGLDDAAGALAVVPKKARTEIVVREKDAGERRSSLFAPLVELEGHAGEVYAARFSPDGGLLATAGLDEGILLWETTGECHNRARLSGHKNAVFSVAWAGDGQTLYSASADKSVLGWDVETGARTKRCSTHRHHVTSVDAARRGVAHFVSASIDGIARLWDPRVRGAIAMLEHELPLTSVAFSADGSQVVTGGLDSVVRVWDSRKNAVVHELAGHHDMVTGLAVSADGAYVLSNSADGTLRSFDIRAFAPEDRAVDVFEGVTHGADRNMLRCAWSGDGEQVAGASADGCAHVWSTDNAEKLYTLPGHRGTINDVAFHPHEPVLATAGSDKRVILGELGGPE